jgi:large subunit ribosomal protein L13
MAKPSTIDKKWVLVDAKDESLGRVGSVVAKLLRGKYEPNFTPHMDCGNNVIIINAAHVQLSGKKWNQKEYIRYTGYPGGQRRLSATDLHQKNNTKLVENAVRGMLPKNKLGSKLFNNMRIFADDQHNLDSVKPETVTLKDLV